MKKRILAFGISTILALILTSSVFAQTYYFTLPKEVVNVYISDQGIMRVDYALTFSNDTSASPIDFVDVGLPNSSYNYSSIRANVDGDPVNISSDYQGDGCCGIAVDLGPKAIRPGKTGTVNVTIGEINRMVFPDDDDKAYASTEFSPTWFGSSYVHGATDLSITFHLPPGITPEEPRYHLPRNWNGSSEPVGGFDEQGRITYTWRDPNANGYTQYTFGASFPRSYVPESAIVTPSIWEKLGISFDDLMGFAFFGCFGLFFFGSPILTAVQAHRRKLQYLPPKIAIEGHGIKRGLTAVEAAILMGQPLDKVMTMILFGVIKKNAAQVTKRDPLEIEVYDPLPQGLRGYEQEFLAAMKGKNLKDRRLQLQKMTVNLVKSVTEKMKGFSRKESTEYYKSINEKAWGQIQAAGTPEVQSQMFEEALEWTMLDKDYDDRARRTFSGPVFVPTWWGRYDPIYRSSPSHPSTISTAPSSSGRTSLPGADFAASVVTGVETFSGKVIGNLNDFTSGVTNVTNPPPPPSKSSGGGSRSGGGSCACACACAGCACACAGGGR